MSRRTLLSGIFVGLVAGIVLAVIRTLRGPAAPAFERPASAAWPSLAGSAAPEPNGAEPADQPAAAAGAVIDDVLPRAPEPLLQAGVEVDSVLPDTASPDSRAGDPAWVSPAAGTCPAGHPIKAKLKSGIYHQPGGLSYDRVVPDRCYVDAASADADGLRPAKR